jgi:glucokinase
MKLLVLTEKPMLLAGDIGGTKTNLAVFVPDAQLQAPLVEATFPSARYESLEELVSDFLSHHDIAVTQAAFGVAGPVTDGRASITNLPWLIDARSMQHEFGWSAVRLINDLEAIAYAVPHLQQQDVHTLNAGTPEAGGTLAIIAPGTGLGEAFLTWNGARYEPHASEGGHADFAPNTATEVELLRYLMGHFRHVSYERVCSGIGIPNIYDFFKATRPGEDPDTFADQLAAARDPTPLIVMAALEANPPPLCAATLDTFVSILAAEAGNLALTVMATGGVYLGGGIPPRLLPVLSDARFRDAFLHKGRFAELMERLPVHVILNPKVALLGAAYAGME